MTDGEFLFLNEKEVARELALKAKELRIHKRMSQKEFAQKCGVNYNTYGKFEREGVISLHGFILIVRHLGRLKELNKLLCMDDAESLGLEEWINHSKKKKAQRVYSSKSIPED